MSLTELVLLWGQSNTLPRKFFATMHTKHVVSFPMPCTVHPHNFYLSNYSKELLVIQGSSTSKCFAFLFGFFVFLEVVRVRFSIFSLLGSSFSFCPVPLGQKSL